jgi:hypothetical protein
MSTDRTLICVQLLCLTGISKFDYFCELVMSTGHGLGSHRGVAPGAPLQTSTGGGQEEDRRGAGGGQRRVSRITGGGWEGVSFFSAAFNT